MKSQKNKNRLATVMLIVLFTILAILIIIPIYTIFLASFKPGGDLLQYGLNLGIDWNRMSLANYELLFTGQHEYWRWFMNSIIFDSGYCCGYSARQCFCRIWICSL